MLSGLAPFAARPEPVVTLPAPWKGAVLVNDPKLAARVLQDPAGFGKTRKRRPVFGRGVLTSEGASWRAQRAAARPFFQPSMLELLDAPTARLAEDLIAEWSGAADDGRPVAIGIDVGRLVARLACRVLFGVELDDRARILSHSFDLLLPPGNWRASLARLRARRALTGVIAEIIAAPESPDSLLTRLRRAKRASPELRRVPLTDEVSTYLLAGSETTATLLGWALGLLAENPEWQRRCRAGGEETITAVLDETLRLYPPAWRITRRANRACALADRTLARGAEIWILPYFMHRDARFWHDAEAFRPDRFLDGDFPRQAFLPFGAGPRACPGRAMALRLATQLLARLLARFTLGAGADRPKPAPYFTLRPASTIALHVSDAPRL